MCLIVVRHHTADPEFLLKPTHVLQAPDVPLLPVKVRGGVVVQVFSRIQNRLNKLAVLADEPPVLG